MRGGAAAWLSLAWLDWHVFVNKVRTVGRHPRRLLLWLILLAWLVPAAFAQRSFPGAARGSGSPFAWLREAAPAASMAPGAALAILGGVLWFRSGRPPAAFQSPADGRFIAGAGPSPRLILVWLAARRARRALLLIAFYLLVAGAAGLPEAGLDRWRLASGILALQLFAGIVFGAGLLAFAGATRGARELPRAAGAALVVAGALAACGAAAALLGMPFPGSVAGAIPPGSWVVAAFQGQSLALIPLAACAAGLTGAGAALAEDCIPELWAASSAAFALKAAAGRGGIAGLIAARRVGRPRTGPARSRAGAHAPAGSLVIAWKYWITIARGRGGLGLQAGILAGSVATGLILGWLSVHGHPEAALAASGYVFLAALVGSALWWPARMAKDLRNPLWWLADSSLRSRLLVWASARALHAGVPLSLLAAAEVVAARQARWAWFAFAGTVFLCMFMQLVGLAAYALLPAATDRRVRQLAGMFATYALLVPVGVAIAPGAVLGSAPLAAGLPVLAGLAEMAALLAFATWRIEGNAFAIAAEEAR